MPTNRLAQPVLIIAALFVAAGGYIHIREWNDTYRHIPSAVDGSWLVRDGFPVDALLSLVAAVALVAVAVKLTPLAFPVAVGTLVFQAGALYFLIATRVGSVFGWSEHTWTGGADQSRIAEIGALVCLVATIALRLTAARRRR